MKKTQYRTYQGILINDNDTNPNDYIKIDLSNNPNKFTNGIETYIYQDNQWKLNGIYEGSTTGAPIKLNENGYKSGEDKADTKYHCLSIAPDIDNIIDFKINGQEMWNTIAFPFSTNFKITANNDTSDLISKVYDSSSKFVNTLTFNIAPNQIFKQNKQLLKKYVEEHMTYGVNNTTYTEIDLNTTGYFLTHKGDNNNNNYVAPSDGTLVFDVAGSGKASGSAWVFYYVNGLNNTHYHFPASFGGAMIRAQVRKGDKVYLHAADQMIWNNIKFFPNEWRFNE